ncbi:MAG: hypothetical protein ACFFC7_33405 [Candidatus Hermodarchaeota archaeon]
MGRKESTLKTRFFYSIYLLKEFQALSCRELARFNEVTERMMRAHLNDMMHLDLIVFQSKRYFLTDKAKKIRLLHEIEF